MTDRYPLEVENVGDDTYIVMSRGHHDIHAFMRKVREDGYDWPLGTPTHKWVKATPCRCGEHHCHYTLMDEPVRGAFPATYAHEDYSEDRYVAQPANTDSVPGSPASKVTRPDQPKLPESGGVSSIGLGAEGEQ